MKRLLSALFAAALIAAAPTADPLIIPVTAGFQCHTQGFTAVGDNLFVTCAERIKQRALLLRYRLPAGFPAAGQRLSDPEVVDLTRDTQWHPSGIDTDGKNLWVAVADYRAKLANATVIRLDPATLKPTAEFSADDHIGTVAVVGGEVWGFNWDSVMLYRFTADGREIGRQGSPARVAFQDCAGGDGFALCSGPDAKEKKSAAVERLMLKDGKVVSERVATPSVPGQNLGREGFTVLPDGRMAFLPGDFPKAEIVVLEKQ